MAYVLEEDELARKDDCYLIMRVVEILEPHLSATAFTTVIQNLKYKGISFESITRARRSYMSKHPELKDGKTEKARREKEQEYHDEYARYTC